MTQQSLFSSAVGYCMDSSCIIAMWSKDYGWYSFDVFPSLKANIEKMIQDGEAAVPKEVLTELSRKDDGAHEWAKKCKLEHPIDANQTRIVSEIMRDFPKLVDTKKMGEQADPFVIALAESKKWTVVTSEKNSAKLRKPNIPDVCQARKVKCISVMDFFREKRWKF
ncbi:hypothetical protein A2529_05055 [Candidatus Peribacteria bacterium RIFOXYD2_FULL_58_15]|nr:MAG: hypothetical protein A2529_05055 [Candidatus Peribacteria bacterium RIFOXYD2_FULL_58_15]